MKHYLTAGLSLILIANVFVFSKIYLNRYTGQPRMVELSERELMLPYRYGFDKEDTSTNLQIKWRSKNDTEDFWYNRRFNVSQEELIRLGFNPSNWESKKAFHALPESELYWLMENDGDTFSELIKALEEKVEAEANRTDDQKSLSEDSEYTRLVKRLNSEQIENSRLFVIDVAKDRETLVLKMDSPNKFIVRGIVKPGYRYDDKGREEGYILNLRRLSVSRINVPLALTASLKKPLENRNGKKPTKFTAVVTWGEALEPWISQLQYSNGPL